MTETPVPISHASRPIDPLDAVFRLRANGRVIVTAACIALALHAAAAPLTRTAHAHDVPRERASAELVVEDLPPPPPPPPPEPEPEQTPPPPEPPRPAPPAPREVAAAAQASAALTAEPDEHEPETDNTIVTGDAETFAGGITETDGTSTVAVRDVGARGAGGAPPPPPPPPPPVDRSRIARCPLDVEWGCEFPDDESAETAIVFAQMHLRPNGSVARVEIVQSPGGSFTREAMRCGLRQKCVPALDRDGAPIAGTTNPIKIRFIR